MKHLMKQGMKDLTKSQLLLMQAGACVLLLGAAAYLWLPSVATPLYVAGVLAFCPMQMLQRYEGRNFVLRRLRRQQLLGAVALLLAGCCMMMQTYGFGFARRNEWVVCLAVGCVLELYTAFRIPMELEKEEK